MGSPNSAVGAALVNLWPASEFDALGQVAVERHQLGWRSLHHHRLLQTSLDTQDFIRVEIGRDRLVPICQPDGAGKPRWTLDNCDKPYLAYSAESGLVRILQADWVARGLKPPLATVLQARLAAALLSMAIDGVGVAWVPLSLASSALAAGKVTYAADGTYRTEIAITLARPITSLSKISEALWRSPAETEIPRRRPQRRLRFRFIG